MSHDSYEEGFRNNLKPLTQQIHVKYKTHHDSPVCLQVRCTEWDISDYNPHIQTTAKSRMTS